jgi:hypothetical protein
VCNYTVTCVVTNTAVVSGISLRYTVECQPWQVINSWGPLWATPAAPALHYPFMIHRWFELPPNVSSSVPAPLAPLKTAPGTAPDANVARFQGTAREELLFKFPWASTSCIHF